MSNTRRGVIVCYESVNDVIDLIGTLEAETVFTNMSSLLEGDGMGKTIFPIPEIHSVITKIKMSDIIVYGCGCREGDVMDNALSLADIGYFVVLALHDDIEHKYVYNYLSEKCNVPSSDIELCFPAYMRLFNYQSNGG